MDSAIDFLRNWLPLGRRDDGSEAAQALHEWLDGMQAAPPEEIAASLAQRLAAMVAVQGNLHMRVRLLDTFDDIAQELLPSLEREIETASLPFSSRTQLRALAADNLLKSFQISVETYRGTVQLSGFVGTKELVEKAEQIAKSVQGVKAIKNDLIVK